MKNIIVTGGSRGLGKEICQHLMKDYNVITLSRSKPDYEVEWYGCHLEDSMYIKYVVQNYVLSKYDTIYGIINNAGYQGDTGNSWELSLSEFTHCMSVNFYAPLLINSLIIPRMTDGGKIISIGGGGSTNSRPYFSPYATSKTALVRYNETLAEEIKSKNIQVNTVATGAMYTNMTEEVLKMGPDKVGMEEYASALQTKMTGGADKSQSLYLISYLLSEKSNFITGRLISALWDEWEDWTEETMKNKNLATLRRIV